MKILGKLPVLVTLFLMVAAGFAVAQPFELTVNATPLRQEVMYSFRIRINVIVTDKATHKPVDRALVHVTYATQKTDGTPVGGVQWKRTKKNGSVWFSFITYTDFIGSTFNFYIRAEQREREGYTECSADVIDH